MRRRRSRAGSSGVARSGQPPPAVGRQLEPQLQRRERVAQAHHGRDHAQVGRDGAQQRLQHRQVDSESVHVRSGSSWGSRTAAASARMLESTNPATASSAGTGGSRELLAASTTTRGQRREGGREPAQVGHRVAAEHGALDDPRDQPPRPHRRAAVRGSRR